MQGYFLIDDLQPVPTGVLGPIPTRPVRPSIVTDGLSLDFIDAHFNPPCMLAPVNCPIVIRIPKGSVRINDKPADGDLIATAIRTSHVANKGDLQSYELANGVVVQGRWPWTYP